MRVQQRLLGGWATALMVAAIAASLIAAPPAAHAQSAMIALGYGVSYGSPARTHLGVDVSCGDGQAIHAPISGKVTFAGYIPTVAGTRIRALTIMGADGALITISPMAQTAPAVGKSVVVGEVVGAAASAGDPSLPTTHAHLSVREGDRYVDPSALAALLFTVAPAPKPTPDSARDAQVVPTPVSTNAAHLAAVPTAVSQAQVTLDPEPSSVRVPRGVGATGPAQLARELDGAPSATRLVLHGATTAPTPVSERPAQAPVAAPARPQVRAGRVSIAVSVFLIAVLTSAAGLGVVQVVRMGVGRHRFVRAFAVRGNR